MMKQLNKQKLLQDNIRYSKQIGILDPEIPRLVFSRRELNELYARYLEPGEHNPATRNTLGRCIYRIRTVYVTDRAPKNRIGEWIPVRKKGWRRYITRPWNYYQQRKVLVHELVHYRRPGLAHGKKFNRLVNEVLKGKTFEPKHIHLFAGHSKAMIQSINSDPEPIQEQKKEYNGTLDYFL